MSLRLLAAAILALSFVMTSPAQESIPSNPSPVPDVAKKRAELEWAKGVADDFLAAWISGNNAEAEMLLTEELKKRYERYPQCTALATRLLDLQYAGLTTASEIKGQMSPDEDEARFTGKLTGMRNRKPIASDFSLRVNKEGGRWRVSYFHQQWRWVETETGSAK